MTKELAKILTDIAELIEERKSNMIQSEEKFINDLKELVAGIVLDLEKQEENQI